MADSQWFTRPDEMLDYICWKHYKSSSGYVEAVLESQHSFNYRLCDQPELLPGELNIYLPDISIPQKFPIKLWDEEKKKLLVEKHTNQQQ
jgi:phage tail protein X